MVELGITLMDSCLDLRARVFPFSDNRLPCFKSNVKYVAQKSLQKHSLKGPKEGLR